MERWHFGFGILMLFGLVGAEMIVWGAFHLVGRPYWCDEQAGSSKIDRPERPARYHRRATRRALS